MNTMNEDSIKALGDPELTRFVILAQAELVARARKRRDDAIAKIKELAGANDIPISIKGTRGRPPAKTPSAKARALPAK